MKFISAKNVKEEKGIVDFTGLCYITHIRDTRELRAAVVSDCSKKELTKLIEKYEHLLISEKKDREDVYSLGILKVNEWDAEDYVIYLSLLYLAEVSYTNNEVEQDLFQLFDKKSIKRTKRFSKGRVGHMDCKGTFNRTLSDVIERVRLSYSCHIIMDTEELHTDLFDRVVFSKSARIVDIVEPNVNIELNSVILAKQIIDMRAQSKLAKMKYEKDLFESEESKNLRRSNIKKITKLTSEVASLKTDLVRVRDLNGRLQRALQLKADASTETKLKLRISELETETEILGDKLISSKKLHLDNQDKIESLLIYKEYVELLENMQEDTMNEVEGDTQINLGSRRLMIFGGSEDWRRRIAEAFMEQGVNHRLVDTSLTYAIPAMSSEDIIVLNVCGIGHKHYYKYNHYIRMSGAPLCRLRSNSVESSLKELNKFLNQ